MSGKRQALGGLMAAVALATQGAALGGWMREGGLSVLLSTSQTEVDPKWNSVSNQVFGKLADLTTNVNERDPFWGAVSNSVVREAPGDGQVYGRSNGTWAVMAAGGSGLPAYSATNGVQAVLRHPGTNGATAYWRPLYDDYYSGLTTLWTHGTQMVYSGAVTQKWVVPAGVHEIQIKAWGGGGGGGGSTYGGADGGFCYGIFPISAGTTVGVMVAQGGATTSAVPTKFRSRGGWPGGGYSGSNTLASWYCGGGGGGCTIVRFGSVIKLVAAGGGGGCNAANAATFGRGGSATGEDGYPPGSTWDGNGGTPVAGGLGGANGAYSGQAGGFLYGGNGGFYYSAYSSGGGGSGYYGGGGGAGINAQNAGGGGASYIASGLQASLMVRGANTTDPDYTAGVAVGGLAGNTAGGGNGYVRLWWYYVVE